MKAQPSIRSEGDWEADHLKKVLEEIYFLANVRHSVEMWQNTERIREKIIESLGYIPKR